MARSEPKQPKPSRVLFEPPVIDRDLLDRILDELGLSETINRGGVRHTLIAHVNAFALGRYYEANTPTIHQDTYLAREMAALIGRLRDGASGFSPMTSLLIDMRFSELTGEERSRHRLFADMETYCGLLAKFGDASFANNRRDEVLRNAVGGLMLYLEILTGNRAKVQRARPDFGTPPRLSSPEASAIGSLLRMVQPELADTTLVNKIEEIRKASRGKQLTNYEHQLFLGGTVTPF